MKAKIEYLHKRGYYCDYYHYYCVQLSSLTSLVKCDVLCKLESTVFLPREEVLHL